MSAEGFQKQNKLHKKSKYNSEYAINNKRKKEYEKSKSKKKNKVRFDESEEENEC